MQKKRSRRSQTKYPALQPEFNLKTRYELIDFDYLKKLTDDEKEWLNNFMEEYANASFNHKGKKIHKEKKHKKDSYDRNNARNRDILTRLKASGQIEYLEELSRFIYKAEDNNLEDFESTNLLENLEKTDDKTGKDS